MNNYRNFTFMLYHNVGGTQNEYLQELYNLVSFYAGGDGITETLCLFQRNHIFTFSLLDICMLTCYAQSETSAQKGCQEVEV
jgi:hypothetical protein